MRLMIAGAAAIAALCFDVPASHAYGNAPWCAVMDVGTGVMVWDCQYYTIEQCVPMVIAGNRGFCNHNPYWSAPFSIVPKTFAPSKHRKRHRG